jgi:hypothetical protein
MVGGSVDSWLPGLAVCLVIAHCAQNYNDPAHSRHDKVRERDEPGKHAAMRAEAQHAEVHEERWYERMYAAIAKRKVYQQEAGDHTEGMTTYNGHSQCGEESAEGSDCAASVATATSTPSLTSARHQSEKCSHHNRQHKGNGEPELRKRQTYALAGGQFPRLRRQECIEVCGCSHALPAADNSLTEICATRSSAGEEHSRACDESLLANRSMTAANLRSQHSVAA